MIIELFMFVWLYFHPSLWTLGYLAPLVLFRRWRPLATVIADMFELDNYDGLTAFVVDLALPAWRSPRVMFRLGAVQDDDQTSADDGSDGSGDPVLPQTHQAEPVSSLLYEPPPTLPSLHRMSRAEEIAMLAVQRNDDGSYRHSANKITDLMGGTAADVKGQIAAIRGPAKPAPASASITRPKRGWGR